MDSNNESQPVETKNSDSQDQVLSSSPRSSTSISPILMAVVSAVAVIAVGFSIFEAVQISNLKQELELQRNSKNETPEVSKNYRIENLKGKDYYIITDDYIGEYDLQFVDQYEKEEKYDDLGSFENEFNKSEIMSLSAYSDYCKAWGFEQKYTDPTKSYAVLSYVAPNRPNVEARLAEVETEGSEVTLFIWDSESGVTADNASYLIVVPVDASISTLSFTSLFSEEEFDNLANPRSDKYIPISYKPIIYLYPEKETEVSVSLGYPELLTTVYPDYNNGWNVLARPDGSLIDLSTGRNLYALYWEGNTVEKPEMDEGFVVAGKDSARFLEEKLAILGLSDREAEEFIVYWLPKLESSPFNLIRFETSEEIEKNMPLSVSPAPDMVIRVMMDFVPLDKRTNVPEQILPTTPKRSGFTVVEWGGSEL